MTRVFLYFALGALAFGQLVPGRYIVELTGETVVDHVTRQRARGGMRGSAATARRAELRREQDGVRQRLGAGVTVLGRVDTVANALLVEADAATVARLGAIPGVKRVRQARVVKLMLDRAVVVNKVTEAWAQIGDDKAGEGIKVAVIDTGVDADHPALKGESMKAPEGYPKVGDETDAGFTNGKVIVARSYVSLLTRRDADMSARDRVGHGTALASIIGGARVAGPLGSIQGVAPRAYIGSYKVFGSPGVNDNATDAAIMKAIDDAVADGMDIINLSLGSTPASRPDSDPLVAAVEKATAAGVLVVTAAGNEGPDFGTISSPGTAKSAIAVGATRNDRLFGSSVTVEGVGTMLAFRSTGVAPAEPVTGVLADVATLDPTGLACGTLPAGSLTGKVALILRGACTFESKLGTVQQAGAVGALVFATEAAPDPITMSVGAATLPAEMISNADGVRLKASGLGALVSMRFTIGPVPQSFDRLTRFSSIGPSVDLAMKPDLSAVGGDVYMATQSADARGDMYNASGFFVANGTSFAAPMVAGSLALLKAARPGLTVAQYRSLIVNTSTGITDLAGQAASVQKTGAGQLHVGAALRSMAAAVPASLSLGTGATASATLRIENLGAESEIYAVSVEPKDGGAAPAPSVSSLEVAAGQGGEFTLAMDGSGLAAGGYEGFVRVTGAVSGTVIRVPYWFGVPGKTPATIPLLDLTATGRAGRTITNAALFRVTDAAGIPITDAAPEVTVLEGSGTVVGVETGDADYPGIYGVTVQLGARAGANTFRIQAGEIKLDFTITGQ